MGNKIRPALGKSCACLRPAPPTLDKKYDVPEENLLGQGTFAKVFKGRNRKTRLEVAVKVIDKANSRRDLLNTEIWILQNFGDHPNIVNFYDMYETEAEVQLVMELMPGGELFDLLDENGPYGEADAAKYLRAIASGLAYLHAGNVVHRDLKPENLLLTSKGADGVLKISDFGLAKILIDEELMKVACGTWIYCAPEVLLLKQRRWGQYDINCDMFSVGCILFIIMSGYHPFDFDGNDDEDLMQECILSDTWDFDDPAWDEVSQHAKDLIEQMLRYDPKERISAAQLAVHPWTCGRVPYGRLSTNVDKDLKRTRASLRNNKLEGAEMVRKSLNVGAAAAPPAGAQGPTQDSENASQPKANPETSEAQTQSPATLVPGREPKKADGTGGSKAVEVPLVEIDAGTGGGGLKVPQRRQSGQSNLSTRSCPQRRPAALPEDGPRTSRKAPEDRFPKKRAPCQPGTDKPGVPAPKNIPTQEPLQNVRAANGARWTKYNLKGNAAGTNRTGDKADRQPLVVANENGESPGPASPEAAAMVGAANGASPVRDDATKAENATETTAAGAGGGTGSASAMPQEQEDGLTSEARSPSGKGEWGGKKKKKPEPKKEATKDNQHSKPTPQQPAADPPEASNRKSEALQKRTTKAMTVDEWKAKRVPKLTVTNANIQASALAGQTTGAEPSETTEAKSPAGEIPAAEEQNVQRRLSRAKAANPEQKSPAAAKPSNSRFTQKKKKGKEKGGSQEVAPQEHKDAGA